MAWMLIQLVIVGYLPGAIVFRWPSAGRPVRASLPAEERLFWAVILSVTTSCVLALALAAAGMYTFGRLVGILIAASLLVAAAARGDLRLGPSAARVRPTALVPVLLVAAGLWLFFPPAEWVLGGRDPGVYTVEGVQIAQHGSLTIDDALVSAVPAPLRELVLRPTPNGYPVRFMGFFVLDPAAGSVSGQFPHLYPVSLAIGYGLDGLTGVRRATGVWALLGLLAVYFAGRLYFGHATAAAAAGLLSLHVAQVWFARYPNAEMSLQALLFAALLAYARMETPPGSRFFAVAAGSLMGVLLFLRVDAMMVLATVGGAVVLDLAVRRRPRAAFVAPLEAWAVLGAAYLVLFVWPYLAMPIGFIQNLTLLHWLLILAGSGGAAVIVVQIRRRRASEPGWLPIALVAAVVAGVCYAYFFRQPGGLLAPHDAYALRTFTINYLTPYLLVAAVIGYALTVPRLFWKHPLMPLLITGFSAFFFYKIRIVPEHFWMARRFLSLILPSMLLFACAAAFYTPWRAAAGRARWLLRARTALGIVMVALAGWQFFQQTRPILPYVEYADAVPRIERLAAQFGNDDLVLIESRGASDLHVLGLPLAYIYGRNVLVLSSDEPVPAQFEALVRWAASRYRRVLFMGSGGTLHLLSRAVDAEPVSYDAFSLPEYERSWDHLPTRVMYKAFPYSVSRLVLGARVTDLTRVDVGAADALAVQDFHASERQGQTPYRWTTARSEMRLRLPAPAPASLTLWMANGGRPVTVPEARVSVYLNDRLVGREVVNSTSFRPFVFPVPAGSSAADGGDGFVVVRLETSAWSPKQALGTADDRELGVMVSRVELR